MEILLGVALAIMTFGMISGRIERSPITPPMVFVVFGMIVGSWGMGLFPTEPETPFIEILATVTLVLVLFTDASRIDLNLLHRQHVLPIRLLGVGLPLTILFGLVVALLALQHIDFWEAALLAAILAPTDAALGQAVVTNESVPVRIRQSLNVESGLNDGLALPVVLLFLSLVSGEQEKNMSQWMQFAALQVTVGPLIGIVVGYLGGQLVVWGQRSGWMNKAYQELSALGLSFLAYSAAEMASGNGFIAAFTAGLTLGHTARSICKPLHEFAEAEGQLLEMLVFMIFGAVLLPSALEHFHWMHLVYAILSLSVIRVVPVAICLIGCHLSWPSILFLGWFGPRGIASILYALLLLEGKSTAGNEMILSVVMTTVALSVLLHGMSAYSCSKMYGRYSRQVNSESPED